MQDPLNNIIEIYEHAQISWESKRELVEKAFFLDLSLKNQVITAHEVVTQTRDVEFLRAIFSDFMDSSLFNAMLKAAPPVLIDAPAAGPIASSSVKREAEGVSDDALELFFGWDRKDIKILADMNALLACKQYQRTEGDRERLSRVLNDLKKPDAARTQQWIAHLETLDMGVPFMLDLLEKFGTSILQNLNDIRSFCLDISLLSDENESAYYIGKKFVGFATHNFEPLMNMTMGIYYDPENLTRSDPDSPLSSPCEEAFDSVAALDSVIESFVRPVPSVDLWQLDSAWDFDKTLDQNLQDVFSHLCKKSGGASGAMIPSYWTQLPDYWKTLGDVLPESQSFFLALLTFHHACENELNLEQGNSLSLEEQTQIFFNQIVGGDYTLSKPMRLYYATAILYQADNRSKNMAASTSLSALADNKEASPEKRKTSRKRSHDESSLHEQEDAPAPSYLPHETQALPGNTQEESPAVTLEDVEAIERARKGKAKIIDDR